MTDKLRQAAEMALKAMQDIIYWYSERDENDEVLQPYNQTPEVLEAIQAVEALRQALTEPPNSTTEVVEPIGEIQIEVLESPFHSARSVIHFYNEPPPVGTKLYAEPPKREWVGLTEEEIFENEWWDEETAYNVNKMLMDRNS